MTTTIAIAVEKSHNEKTGKVSATYVTQKSCPDGTNGTTRCSFMDAGCYAENGPAGFTTARLNKAAAERIDETPETIAQAEADAIATLTGKLPLRVHVVGDCATDEAAHIVSGAMLAHTEKHGQSAWSYTHAWRDVRRDSWQGANVLASCETPDDVREAQAAGWATAIVVEQHPSPRVYNVDGINILPCPAEVQKGVVNCASCGLCSRTQTLRDKNLTIGFAAHGAKQKTVRATLAGLNA